jgi:hypothetical protein
LPSAEIDRICSWVLFCVVPLTLMNCPGRKPSVVQLPVLRVIVSA